MLKVEKIVGEPLENYLPKIYNNDKKSADYSVINLGIHRVTLCRWAKKFGLEKETKRPSRKELDYSYNFLRKPVRQAAREIGVNTRTYYRWLEDANIERRLESEAYLPEGVIRPPREELSMLLTRKSNIEVASIYGINPHTLRTWKQKEGIHKFRKSKYYNLSLRILMLKKLVESSYKNIEELSLEDFGKVKQPDGKSFRGLINWYLSRYAHIFSIAKIEFIKYTTS